MSILLLLARFLLGLKNGVRAAHKAKEFRKGVGGVRNSLPFLTQAAEPPVLGMTIRGLLFFWAKIAPIPEGDWIGLTAIATLKTRPSFLAELYS